MEGYDLRTRSTAPRSAIWRAENGTVIENRASRKTEQVTSWRNNVGAQPVLASAADPYAWILQSTRAAKERMAKASGAYGAADFEVVEDNGHPFKLQRYYCENQLNGLHYGWYDSSGTGSAFRTGGPLVAAGAVVAPEQRTRMLFFYGPSGEPRYTFSNSTNLTLFNPGASLLDDSKRFINIAAPGQPTVDLPAMLGELLADPLAIPFKDINPWRRPRTIGDSARKGAGEFLNWMFGVTPTINDLIKFAKALETLSTRILQYERDIGKPIRRFRALPGSVKTVEFSGAQLSNQGRPTGGLAPGWNLKGTVSTHGVQGNVSATLRQTVSETNWFSASFRYFVPASLGLHANIEKYLRELDHQIRITNSYSAMWQVTPWSWLIDWFLDVQTSISLAEKVMDDSLVINYAYGMRHTKLTSELTQRLTPLPGRTVPVPEVRTKYVFETKERIRANPYGFISPNSPEITPLRWAILAALGISRRGFVN